MGSDWEAAEQPERMNERDNEAERDDGPEARAAAALLNAFGDLFHTGGMVELDDSALRTIGKSYGSACFYYGLERPKGLNKLLKAMVDYSVLVPESEPFLFPSEVPF